MPTILIKIKYNLSNIYITILFIIQKTPVNLIPNIFSTPLEKDQQYVVETSDKYFILHLFFSSNSVAY